MAVLAEVAELERAGDGIETIFELEPDEGVSHAHACDIEGV